MGAGLSATLGLLGPYAKITFGLNYAVWLLHAAPNGSDKFYDLTGAVSFGMSLLLAATRDAGPNGLSPRAMAILAAGFAWCTRLGSFLFTRILRDGTDRRQKFKGHPLLFLIPFSIQAVWTLCLCTPAILAARYGSKDSDGSKASERAATTTPLGWVDALLGAAWIFGFALEVVADRQKHAFAEAGLRAHPTKGFITTGVWSVSRHPNYMGEIILWVAMAMLAYRDIGGNPSCPAPAAVFVAPLVTYILLNHVSGIPLLEGRARKVWGNQPEFQRYVETTPVLWGNPIALIREILNA